MLSYASVKNVAKIYSYNRCVYSIECENNATAKVIALMTCRLLEAGDFVTTLQVAHWNMDNPREGAVNISLGSHYFVKVADWTIRDMDNQVVHTLQQ